MLHTPIIVLAETAALIQHAMTLCKKDTKRDIVLATIGMTVSLLNFFTFFAN